MVLLRLLLDMGLVKLSLKSREMVWNTGEEISTFYCVNTSYPMDNC